MLNTQEVQGRWNQLKGKVKERWGQLTDDDLQLVGGNVDQLVGKIQQRTGEQRQVIENVFNDLLKGGEKAGTAVQHAKQAVGQYAQEAKQAVGQYAQEAAGRVREGMGQAQEKVRESFDDAREAVNEGYEQTRRQVSRGMRQAEQVVRERPTESVATLFGIGLLAGVLTGVLLHSDD